MLQIQFGDSDVYQIMKKPLKEYMKLNTGMGKNLLF